MRGIGKRNVSLLMILMVAFMLLVGCGAKEEESEAKSLGQELFPDSTGLLDTLKMVQEGGGSSGNYAMGGDGSNEGTEETGASADGDGGNGNAGAGSATTGVGLIADLTDTIKSPEDYEGEWVNINNAFGEPHDVCIKVNSNDSENSYDWYFYYESDDPFSFSTTITGDKLDYAGVYYFGQDIEEFSIIMATTDKDGNPHTMIGSYIYDEEGGSKCYRYWTTEGMEYSVLYDPMDGAFEGYNDGSVTVGGTTYKLGDNLTLIP